MGARRDLYACCARWTVVRADTPLGKPRAQATVVTASCNIKRALASTLPTRPRTIYLNAKSRRHLYCVLATCVHARVAVNRIIRKNTKSIHIICIIPNHTYIRTLTLFHRFFPIPILNEQVE